MPRGSGKIDSRRCSCGEPPPARFPRQEKINRDFFFFTVQGRIGSQEPAQGRPKPRQIVVDSHFRLLNPVCPFMLKAGIVGLPNVGKSTLFNALIRAHKAAAENYPFCTVEPNIGVVTVPDLRLDALVKVTRTPTVIPTAVEFVDIAGLVRGASQGEGLGNKFLSHIREVDAIVQVVRCFEDPDIHHVTGSIDPVRDIETINTELVISDLEAVKKKRASLAKDAKRGDKEAVAQDAVLAKLEPHL